MLVCIGNSVTGKMWNEGKALKPKGKQTVLEVWAAARLKKEKFCC